MQLNPPPPPVEPPPPPPPPESSYWPAPAYGSQWGWPGTPPPPPPNDRPGHQGRLLILVAVVASVALVAVIAVGFVAAARQAYPPVPDIGSQLSLPPVPTPPPVTDVQPLPSALPTGSTIPVVWQPTNDGVVRVVPTSDGVDLTLLQLNQEESVPIPVPTAMPALRVDATETATTDSQGNHIGLACRTADHVYGATFAIDAYGERFMTLDGPDGPDTFSEMRSGVINDISTPNQLSAVCIEHSKTFEMMFAINGSVVADEEVPAMTTQPLFPALYICSCNGHEATHNSAITVSSLPSNG